MNLDRKICHIDKILSLQGGELDKEYYIYGNSIEGYRFRNNLNYNKISKIIYPSQIDNFKFIRFIRNQIENELRNQIRHELK